MSLTVNLKSHDHEAFQTAKAAALEAGHNAELSLSIPEEVKAAIRPYVKPIVAAVFGVVTAGVDAGLNRLPIIGSVVAGIVNPLLVNLQNVAVAKLTALLA